MDVYDNAMSYDDALSDAKFEQAIIKMKNGFKKPKLNRAELKLLEFCHGRDMKEFLREQFEKYPIKLNANGELIGENPFDKERAANGISESYKCSDPLFESIQSQSYTTENQ